MAVGYLLHANQRSQQYNHNPQRACFYTDGRWWLVSYADPGADWYLFEQVGLPPSEQGTVGGWDYAQTSSGNVLISSTGSVRPDVFWDEARGDLHVLAIHGTELYRIWHYTVSTGLWSATIPAEDTGTVLASGAPEMCSIVVDSNGIPWIAYFDPNDSYKLKTRYRSGGSWSDGPVLESVGSSNTPTVDLVVWSKEGTQSVGAAYTYKEGTNPAVWKFAYWPDDPNLLPESWTYETIDVGSIDNHISVAAGNVGGGTGSTVVVVVKTDEDSSIRLFHRPPGSSWKGPVVLTEAEGFHGSRHKVVIDESNKEVYVVYGRGEGEGSIDGIVYQKLPIDNLSVTDEFVALETDSPPAFPLRAVPRPWRPETPDALPYPILSGMSRPCLPAPRLAGRRCCRQPLHAGGAAGAASGGRGGAKKWLCISYPPLVSCGQSCASHVPEGLPHRNMCARILQLIEI